MKLVYPVDPPPAVPVGSPVYIVLRMAGGRHQVAHESAVRQGEVIERGLTREAAINRALALNIAAAGQGGPTP